MPEGGRDEDLLKSDARTLSNTLREEAEFTLSSGSHSGQSSGSDSTFYRAVCVCVWRSSNTHFTLLVHNKTKEIITNVGM